MLGARELRGSARGGVLARERTRRHGVLVHQREPVLALRRDRVAAASAVARACRIAAAVARGQATAARQTRASDSRLQMQPQRHRHAAARTPRRRAADLGLRPHDRSLASRPAPRMDARIPTRVGIVARAPDLRELVTYARLLGAFALRRADEIREKRVAANLWLWPLRPSWRAARVGWAMSVARVTLRQA